MYTYSYVYICIHIWQYTYTRMCASIKKLHNDPQIHANFTVPLDSTSNTYEHQLENKHYVKMIQTVYTFASCCFLHWLTHWLIFWFQL